MREWLEDEKLFLEKLKARYPNTDNLDTFWVSKNLPKKFRAVCFSLLYFESPKASKLIDVMAKIVIGEFIKHYFNAIYRYISISNPLLAKDLIQEKYFSDYNLCLKDWAIVSDNSDYIEWFLTYGIQLVYDLFNIKIDNFDQLSFLIRNLDYYESLFFENNEIHSLIGCLFDVPRLLKEELDKSDLFSN